MRNTALTFFFTLAALLLPQSAHAYSNLTCMGPVPVGTLYDLQATCSGVTGLSNIFSGLVCDFQSILDAVMVRVYCGVQFTMLEPIRLMVVLFVIIYGIQLLMGYVQANTREVVTRLIKLGMVWMFATESTWGIGIMYNFFIDAANQGIGWVMAVVPMPAFNQPNPFCVIAPLVAPYNIERITFRYMDYLICKTVTGPFTAQGAAVAGFFAVMSYMIPPLFLMFTYFTMKSLAIFIRCLLSYLLGISAIAFMITLSPIFLSLALFRPTYRFFDDWLRYLVSFTLQIVLIFAGAALWITVIGQLGAFFDSLAAMVRPVQEIVEMGQLRPPVQSWGVCQYRLAQTFWGPVLQCTDRFFINPVNGVPFVDPPPIKPSQLLQQPVFLFFVVTNLLTVCIVVYVFDTLMKMIPGLAKQLAGPGYAPQLGGGSGLGATKFANLLSLENVGKDSKNFTDKIGGMLGKRK